MDYESEEVRGFRNRLCPRCGLRYKYNIDQQFALCGRCGILFGITSALKSYEFDIMVILPDGRRERRQGFFDPHTKHVVPMDGAAPA